MRLTILKDIEFGSKSYNTNNLEADIDNNVIDYETYIKKVNITNYLNYLEYYPYPHVIIPLLKEEQELLIELGSPSLVSSKVTIDLTNPDIQNIIRRWDKYIPKSDSGYFMRLNSASPKDSFYECRIWSATDIIKTMVSSARVYKVINKGVREHIILKEWNSKYIDRPQYEFRVFVHESKITAISQYHCETHFVWPNTNNNLWETIVNNIVSLYNRCNKFPNCVMDIYINEDLSAELIEFNSFGMELASGSALFEWSKDRNVLYGKENDIEIRILSK